MTDSDTYGDEYRTPAEVAFSHPVWKVADALLVFVWGGLIVWLVWRFAT